MDYVTREMIEGDRSYIVKTILFGMIELDRATRRINRDSFLTQHNKWLNKAINASNVIVIADTEEKNLIYGFIIYQQSQGEFDIIHYAYMRKDFRELGILKNLVPVIKTRNNLCITSINNCIEPARLKSFYDKVIFDPYFLYNL
jgi:hypothetical protein